MKRVLLACLLAFSIVAPLGVSAPAHAWNKGNLPACTEPLVISTIINKFRYADTRTFHWGVRIRHLQDVYESREVIRNTSLIGRRFCRATALMTDGRYEEVAYLIETKQGFASMSWRVESCLPAYDPWHVYGAWCRSIRP